MAKSLVKPEEDIFRQEAIMKNSSSPEKDGENNDVQENTPNEGAAPEKVDESPANAQDTSNDTPAPKAPAQEAQPKEQEKPAVQEKPEVVNEPVPGKEQKEDKSKEKVLDVKASKLLDVQENTPDKGASPEKEGASPKDEQKIEQVKQSDETSTAMSQAAANKEEEQAKQTEAAPKCHSERIEETDDITQEKKSERSEAKRNSSFFTFHSSLKLISFIACWILLAIGVVLGIYAYQAHKQKVIEERNEIIRQEIYRRQLQDSIKSLQDSILHLTTPMNAKDTLTAPDSIPSR